MAKPGLLLLDEPSQGLAPLVLESIFERISALNESGLTFLLVEQDVELALSVAHRGHVMESGVIAAEGDVKDLPADGRLRDMYLGR